MNNHRIKIVFLLGVISILAFSASAQNLLSGKIRAKVLASGFIYEKASFAECHASTIVETDNGLLAAWFGGTHEKHPDVCIYTSAFKDGKWSNPQQVADGIVNETLRYPCWNPVLFKRDNGDVILYYKVGPSPGTWWGMYKISTDHGKSWSAAIKLPDNFLGPIKNKPEKLSDGAILYPTSFETPQRWNVYVETSDQALQHWSKTEIDNKNFNAIQPTILLYKGGKIQLLCRSKEKKIVETWSNDQGKTWTPLQATSILNNNSGIDAATLDNGLQLLVCNPVEKGRNKLAVLASVDGKTWNNLIVLEDLPKGEFSYPAMIRGKDGTVYITYTYNREKIKFVHLKILEE